MSCPNPVRCAPCPARTVCVDAHQCSLGHVTHSTAHSPTQSRLAVNSVIAEDYGRPLVISRFVSELYAGFQLLNLKNDGLRKRFDGIKYDIKKIEEIVYDISIRGLARTDRAAGAQ